MNDLPLEQKRTWVISLMIECPMGKSLEDCPAREVRGLPLAQIAKLVDGMSEEELSSIIDHHKRCLRERESQHARSFRWQNK